MSRPKTIVSWSSGKDSAWALAALNARRETEVVGLLTTFNQDAGRVSMHAVREELVEAQARSVGLPLLKVMLPAQCSDAHYEATMGEVLGSAKADGVEAVAFGDLFLQDVRRYRQERLATIGMTAVFPLWGADTRALAHEMVAAGVRARVTSVDTQRLGAEFVGRTFDDQFVADLPVGVDPCGERGEFHTFAYKGPPLSATIPVVGGEVVSQGRFVFADVRLARSEPPR